jgi:uncharacterized protein (TIGR01440 family)
VDTGLIVNQAKTAVSELIEVSKLKEGQILVVGCSTSEINGYKIGTVSNMEIASAVYSGIAPILKEHRIYLAAQCCEHLNRALVIEREAAEKYGFEQVNVLPQACAGGSFSVAVYQKLENPVLVEFIRAHAGMDIGNTLIGMHLKHVAVPVRVSVKKIGQASLVCARTRAKFIGGSRAIYDERLL